MDKGLLHGGGRQADVCDDDPVVYSWAARQLQGTRGGRGRCHVALEVSICIYKLARWTLCAAPGQGSGLGLERGVLVGAAGLPGGTGRGQAGGERGEAGEQGRHAAVERGDECGEAALEADAGRGAPVADLQTAIRVYINVWSSSVLFVQNTPLPPFPAPTLYIVMFIVYMFSTSRLAPFV